MDHVEHFYTDRSKFIAYLRDSLDGLKRVANAMDTYYEKLEVTNFAGAHPVIAEMIDRVQKLVGTKLDSAIRSVARADWPKPGSVKMQHRLDVVNIAFETHAAFFEAFLGMQYLHDAFNDNQVDVSQAGTYSSSGAQITEGYVIQLAELLGNLEIEYLKQTETFNSGDFTVVLARVVLRVFAGESVKPADVLKLLEMIGSAYTKYSKSKTAFSVEAVIDLYTGILDLYLDQYGDRVTPETRYATKLVERLKYAELVDNDPRLSERPRPRKSVRSGVPTPQKLVQMLNLVPSGDAAPISDHLAKLGVSIRKAPKKSKTESPAEVATILKTASKALSTKQASIGFIVIYKVVESKKGTVLSSHIMQLIDRAYIKAHGLEEPLEAGVSEKTLDRTNTIRENAITCAKSAYNTIVKVPGDKYYILDTLDGSQFRLLTPWRLTGGVGAAPAPMPAEWIENLDRPQITPSRKLEAYNNILDDAICAHVQAPILSSDLVSRADRRQERVKWTTVRAGIKKEILAAFHRSVGTSKTIKRDELDKLITNTDLYQSGLQHIVTSISSQFVGTGKTLTSDNRVKIQKYNAELYLATMSDVFRIQTGIARTIGKIFRKSYYSKLDESVSITKAETAFGEILDEVLKRYVNEKSNVYLTIENKVELAEKTLLATPVSD